MTYGDERGGDDGGDASRRGDQGDRGDRGDQSHRSHGAAGSVGTLPAGDCWPTEGFWPAGPSYWLPRPRAGHERGAHRRPAAGRTTWPDRGTEAEPDDAEPDLAGAFLRPGEDHWPAGEDYWTGPGLGGRGAGLKDQAAGLAADRDEPVYDYPVYDYEDGQS
jgi:hypothetical protein